MLTVRNYYGIDVTELYNELPVRDKAHSVILATLLFKVQENSLHYLAPGYWARWRFNSKRGFEFSELDLQTVGKFMDSLYHDSKKYNFDRSEEVASKSIFDVRHVKSLNRTRIYLYIPRLVYKENKVKEPRKRFPIFHAILTVLEKLS